MEEYRTIEGAVSFNQAVGHYRNVEIDEQAHVLVGYPVLSFDYRTSDAKDDRSEVCEGCRTKTELQVEVVTQCVGLADIEVEGKYVKKNISIVGKGRNIGDSQRIPYTTLDV